MSRVRMDIETVFVGGGPVQSVITLRPRRSKGDEHVSAGTLPINIGRAEAAAIAIGAGHMSPKRPFTHDLLLNTIKTLGAEVRDVCVTQVRDKTFFAQINVVDFFGDVQHIDAKPSDAIALALRAQVPIYVEDHVLTVAAQPDFTGARKEAEAAQIAEFHDFVEGLNPEDFE